MRTFIVVAFVILAFSPIAWGDDNQTKKKADSDTPAVDNSAEAEQARLFELFTETLDDVKFVGRFTIVGQDDGPLRKEEYTISSVEKQADGDYWIFNTRIKYGKNDVQVPLRLEVKWAGTTPVITLTDFTIPGLGTFSARVVIYHNQYAGTWSHGAVGGHLFGTIQKNKAETNAESATEEKAEQTSANSGAN